MCSLTGSPGGLGVDANSFRRGAAINQLCSSIADPHARREFSVNEDAYCLCFGLNRDERQAVKDRDYVMLVRMGAQVAHLDILAALSGLTALEAIRKRSGVSASSAIAKLLRLGDLLRMED
jgi:protocatechuate 4,5-dioxygenase alpha chain